MQLAVFLDRDGVINKTKIRCGKPCPPVNISQLEIIPGVKQSLNALHDAGYLIIVITNQPDVSRGKALKVDVDLINDFLMKHLSIDEIRTCFHDDVDKCECRKPLPGNILNAAKKFDINLSQSFMVGDRWRDVEAGISAGCKTIFIDYKYNEKQPSGWDFKVSSLSEAADLILGIGDTNEKY
jgi:D-glycero-D-manno-heptose 1,7-bisphosphate phosphatase